MKITPIHIVVVVLALAVAVLAACLFIGDPAPSAPAPAPVVSAPKVPSSVPEIPSALERALRRRIRQLEAELAAARNPSAQTNDPRKAEIHVMPQQADFRPPSPREMMENLKKNDPQRYEKFQRHFREMRKRQLARTKGRLEFLNSVDTSGMTEAERTNHDQLQELLAQRENLPDFSEMSEEEARTAMQQRHELDRAIRAASEAERKTLLDQTARALGLEGDDAAVLTETVREIVQATESNRGFPPGPPPDGAPAGAPGGGR